MIKRLIFYGIVTASPLQAQENPFDPPSKKIALEGENGNNNFDVNGDLYCDGAKGLFTVPILKKAGEASLFKGASGSVVSVRMAVSPARGKPIILRMYERSGGYYISVRRLSGLGGYELGHVELFGEISISKQDFIDVTAMMDRETLLNMSKMTLQQRNDTLMMDSSSWSLEYLNKSNYKVIDLYSAEKYADGAVKLSPQLTKRAMNDFLEVARRLFRLADMSTMDYLKNI